MESTKLKSFTPDEKIISNNNLNKLYLTNIFILDWDDTLFPTTWVNLKKINLSNNEEINNYKVYFLELDKTISTFLEYLNKIGDIYIVTNANIKWIKSCLTVLNLTSKIIMMNNIRIVSARDLYSNSVIHHDEWKIHTFKDILINIVEKVYKKVNYNSYLNIISMGDAQYEYNALLNLDSYFKINNKHVNYLLKNIKFIEKPNFEYIIDELQVTQKNIKNIVNSLEYVDLKFKN
jgi:hypothetical protein